MEDTKHSLETLFIYNPTNVPLNSKADEQEQIEAKMVFFYPSLLESHVKRSLLMIAESLVLVFNRFSSSESDEAELKTETNVLHLDKKVIISKKMDSSNFLVLIFKYETSKMDKLTKTNSFFPISLKIYDEAIQTFIDTFLLFFGEIESKTKSPSTLIPLTECLVNFIEIYFKKDCKTFETHSLNLMKNFVHRRKIEKSALIRLLNLSTILQMNHPELIDFLIFKKGFLVYSTLEAGVASEINNLLFDFLDFERFKNSEKKILASNFEASENYFYRKIEGWKNGILIGSQIDNLPALYISNIQKSHGPVYYSVLNQNGTICVFLFSQKQTKTALFSTANKHLKDIQFFDCELEQFIFKTRYIFFYNCLNFSFSNSVDLGCFQLMNAQILSSFLNTFQTFKKCTDLKTHFTCSVLFDNQGLFMNLLNGRILTIFTTNNEKINLWNEFQELSEKLSNIII